MEKDVAKIGNVNSALETLNTEKDSYYEIYQIK